MVQSFDVLSAKGFFFFCTLLKVLKQGISSSVSLALIIIDLEVVTREFLSPVDFFRAQTLYIYKPTEVVLVDKYEHFMLRLFQIVIPSLESLNNS